MIAAGSPTRRRRGRGPGQAWRGSCERDCCRVRRAPAGGWRRMAVARTNEEGASAGRDAGGPRRRGLRRRARGSAGREEGERLRTGRRSRDDPGQPTDRTAGAPPRSAAQAARAPKRAARASPSEPAPCSRTARSRGRRGGVRARARACGSSTEPWRQAGGARSRFVKRGTSGFSAVPSCEGIPCSFPSSRLQRTRRRETTPLPASCRPASLSPMYAHEPPGSAQVAESQAYQASLLGEHV